VHGDDDRADVTGDDDEAAENACGSSTVLVTCLQVLGS
jgi:hypothetical protein